MRIGGVMVARNESRKAALVMSYHLNVLGFEQFIFIDHNSTDDSVAYLAGLGDKRIEIVQTGDRGYDQANWKNKHTGRLFERGFDVVIQVDADMFYVGALPLSPGEFAAGLDGAVSRMPFGFLAPNYKMLPLRECDELSEAFWKEIVWREYEPMCRKAVVTRAGWDLGLRLNDGDHGVDRMALPRAEAPYVLEYHAISHDDLVRKTIVNGIGWIQRAGGEWLRGLYPHGRHHVDNFRKLMTRGHLWPEWKSNRYTVRAADTGVRGLVRCETLSKLEWKVGVT